MAQMNSSMKQNDNNRNRNSLTDTENRLVAAKGEEGGGEMDWEFGVSSCENRRHVRLFATPRTIQSMEFSRPECWSG